MAVLKAGTRLRSAVCTTEVMIVAAPKDDVDVRCGGVALIAIAEAPDASASPAPDHSSGTQIGKRYVDAAGTIEILCTKPGPGSLSTGDVALAIKSAKPLPSSD